MMHVPCASAFAPLAIWWDKASAAEYDSLKWEIADCNPPSPRLRRPYPPVHRITGSPTAVLLCRSPLDRETNGRMDKLWSAAFSAFCGDFYEVASLRPKAAAKTISTLRISSESKLPRHRTNLAAGTAAVCCISKTPAARAG